MTTLAWDTKHPRTQIGRFADKPQTMPEASLALIEAIDESFPVPQANSLESISVAVAAVAADVNTASAVAQALDFEDRQGAYYLNAAGYLGLVSAHSDFESGAQTWSLTALGQHMTALPDDERAALLVQLAEATPGVQGFRDAGFAGATDAIAERSELSDDTIERRARTASSWAAAIDGHNFADGEAQIMELARDRFQAAASAAQAERAAARRAPKAPVYCGECFTELPATGVCGSFACG